MQDFYQCNQKQSILFKMCQCFHSKDAQKLIAPEWESATATANGNHRVNQAEWALPQGNGVTSKWPKEKLITFRFFDFWFFFHVLKTKSTFHGWVRRCAVSWLSGCEGDTTTCFQCLSSEFPSIFFNTHTHQCGEINWVLEHLVDPGCTDCLTSGTAPDLLTNN